jgi:hypothetical protein
MQLTDTSVRAPKAPEAGVKVYAHDTRTGFGVRVSQAGAKSFVLSTGKTRGHVTIGRYPIMAMAEARKIAGLITAERAVGRHQMPRIAFGAALNLYEGSNTSPSSPRDPKKGDWAAVTKRRGHLRPNQLADITAHDITNVTDKIAPAGGVKNPWNVGVLYTFLPDSSGSPTCFAARNLFGRVESIK